MSWDTGFYEKCTEIVFLLKIKKLRIIVVFGPCHLVVFYIRSSIACAATNAEFKNCTILHDNILNLPVVAQQPLSDPNYVPHAVVARLGAAQ